MGAARVLSGTAEFRAALAAAVAGAGVDDPVVGLIPTMGALHSGHAALVDAARAESDVVIASIFVNPLQFEDREDYLRYPRSLENDLEELAAHGTDLVFAPDVQEMYPGYPEGPLIRVTTGELGRRWEGASRPGHFDGVATVVAKLFGIMAPPAPARLQAWFGEKDAEQIAVIRRLTADLNLPVQVRSLPIVRDEGGLALSSRNRRLTDTQAEQARALHRTLDSLHRRAERGEPLEVEGLREELARSPGVTLDYLVVVDPSTLREARADELLDADGALRDRALALVAARVGPVRLIDNMMLPGPQPP